VGDELIWVTASNSSDRCVEIAYSETPAGTWVRNSRQRDIALFFTDAEWGAFVRGMTFGGWQQVGE
jgi:hypothetical protein